MKKMIWLITASVIAVGLIFGGFLIYDKHKMAKALDLPMVYVETENQEDIVSKDDYLNCKISISNTKEEFELENESARIKGRGNSTWFEYSKKPYKIKFDNKVDLFGNGKAKEWTLIANHGDQSLMRNYLAYTLASQMEDLKYTTTTQFVDLYVNDKYTGVYLLCEQVEVGSNRVDIDEDLTTLDTGYLLELDDKIRLEGEENKDWFYSGGESFAIKSPDTEDEEFTDEHLTYIKNYMDNCFSILKSNNYQAVQEVIDVNSFADSYILNELFKTTDVFMSSFYVYKDAGLKLCSGPVWDYDLSSGNCMYDNHSTETDYLYAKRNVFYNLLLNYDEFEELVSEKLAGYKTKIEDTIESSIEFVKENYSRSIERNFDRWKIQGIYVWGNSKKVASIDSWEGQVEFLKDWLFESLDYMVEVYI